ncbi:MAG: bifunctional glycosyltransferase family 2 protein/CDP-glycerol:glycerophosphate glycerophosphotransferase, partial [Actinomycetia bacterium]|nr:bifunctional glycosyltransferase family 2 protein/CDP-glycerol:glycerophosphate glycerophosphotransferase [Actinomycetes bacterium]
MSSRVPRAGDTARAVARRMPHPVRRRLTIALHRSPVGRRLGRDESFVSVVVATTGNHAAYLAECLDSIRAQTRGAFEVIVVPYADGAPCERVAAAYCEDDWRFAVAPAASGYGAALNAGARRAQGEYLTFVGATDTVPPYAFERLVGSLESTGSDFAVGNLHDAAPDKHLVRPEHGPVHRRDRLGVALADAPDALADIHVGNRLFRRRFWRGAGLAFVESDTAPPSLPISRAYADASRFDLLREVTYHLTKRGDGVPFGYLQPAAPGLREWRTGERRARTGLEESGSAEAVDAWIYAVLDIAFRPYVFDAERFDKQEWALLRDTAADLLGRASNGAWRRVRPEARVATWLAAHDMRAHLESFAALRWFENGQHPTYVRDGKVYARLPYADDPELDVPSDCYALADREIRPVVSVQRINWTANGLQLDLYAYLRFVDMRQTAPDVTVALVRGDEEITLDVDVHHDPAVTRHAAQRHQNYDYGAIRATLPTDSLETASRGEWVLRVTIAAESIGASTGATDLGWQGSAAALRAYSGPKAWVTPTWAPGRGLVLTVADSDMAHRPDTSGFTIDAVEVDGTTIDVYGAGEGALTGVLECGGTRLDATVETVGDRRHLRFEAVADAWSMGSRPAPPGAYHLHVHADGKRVPGRYADSLLDELPSDHRGDVYRVRVRRSPHGTPVLELAVPLAQHEQGPYAQTRLQEAYTGDHDIDEQAVYLQAYAGQSATDSPLAIHYALRQMRPDLTLYWGVADHSQWVPEGGVPLLMRSEAWYAVLATAKYVVSNIDFERWFVRRAGQRVMQTYHGVPSKTMGIGLWKEKRFTPRRIEQQLARTSDLWDALLTPTPEVNRYYREAYRYDGPIIDHGYPRDDALAGREAAATREEVRRRLGIAEGQTAVLYAPTWRDDVATG